MRDSVYVALVIHCTSLSQVFSCGVKNESSTSRMLRSIDLKIDDCDVAPVKNEHGRDFDFFCPYSLYGTGE